MVGESGKSNRLGPYEIGRTLGEGNFGKVKLAKNLRTGESVAVKILQKEKLFSLKITDQIMREISTLKILKHPNIVRLYEVLASKTKIYMIFEYVDGGELLDRISGKGKLPEKQGRRFFQQLIDAISYCHEKGVFHRDLKLDNILMDAQGGNIKVSDFGLSAMARNFREDGLLHTACGTPHYVAPEILAYRGYDGAAADIWSCGVVLFVMLTGRYPFDDRNRVVLFHKIAKGEFKLPNCLSPGAQNLLKRILEPNPAKRITMSEIKAHEWFREGYNPSNPEDDEEDNFHIDEEAFSMNEEQSEGERSPELPTLNAFQLISMASFFDLSGFFEQEDASARMIRFASNLSHKLLLERIEEIVTGMGFRVQRKNGKLKVVPEEQGHRGPGSLYVSAEVFEISPSLYVVELRKSHGDGSVYRQLCRKLSNDLGVSPNEQFTAGQEFAEQSYDDLV